MGKGEKMTQAISASSRPAAVLFLLAFALLLAGCGRGREDESLVPVDLTPVAISYVAFNQLAQSSAEQVAIERFQELAPGVTVERETYSRSPGSYLTDTPTPDVMLLWDGYLLRSAAVNGLLSDLSDVWSENGFEDAYGDQFRDLSRMEGNLYFVPGGFSWTGVYYNKSVFEQYGLAPPQTWDQLMQIADTLLANGETPFAIAGQNPFVGTLWFDYLNMRMNGPEFHRNLMAGRESYTDERVARVWERWVALVEQGYFVENAGQSSDLTMMTALVRGDSESPLNRQKAVMALASPLSGSELPDIFREELDFFQFPVMDPGLPVGEASITFGYVIPAGAPNRLQAGAFVGFMGSAQAEELLLQQYGADAGYVPVHQEFDRSLLSAETEQGEQIVRGADDVGPPLFLALPDEMQAGFNRVLRRLFLRSSNPVEVAELQLILEDARQEAVQSGAYTP